MKTRNVLLPFAVTLAIGFLSTSAVGQAPKGAKQNADRAKRQRGQRDAASAPQQVAEQMLTEYDRDRDTQLQPNELAIALTAQRQNRGPQEAAGAEQPRTRQGGKRQRGTGQRQRGNQNQPGQRQQRGGRGDQRRGRGAAPGNDNRQPGNKGDAAKIVQKMMSEFDKNNSGGLDAAELARAMEARRENRGQMRQKGQGAQADKRRANAPDGNAKGKRKGDGKGRENRAEKENNAEPGTGVSPERRVA